MNYKESIIYLDNIPKLNSPLGTENILRLLNKMNNPQNNLKVIHVGGTNGKGSVSNMIKSILLEESYNVGLFNSPYILSYRETITYNNEMISEEYFAKIMSNISLYCKELVEENHPHPTAFECYTALALEFFNLMSVDFAIIEVGLGGQDDATNVFKSPLMTIITSIAYDHTEFLGNSLKEIASSKAGIIKYNTPLIVAPNSNEALEAIFNTASTLNSPYYYISNKELTTNIYQKDLMGMSFSIKTPYFDYQKLHMKLIGNHQLTNASLALMAIEILKNKYGYKISNNSVKLGIANTYWPCRCEYIEYPTPILIDGAHNEQSMDTFIQVLTSYCSNMPITFLFGILKDKKVEQLLQKIKPFSDTIFVTTPLSPRALPISELANISKKYFNNVNAIYDANEALKSAIEYSKKTGSLLCCVGSLYLSIPVRNWLDY